MQFAKSGDVTQRLKSTRIWANMIGKHRLCTCAVVPIGPMTDMCVFWSFLNGKRNWKTMRCAPWHFEHFGMVSNDISFTWQAHVMQYIVHFARHRNSEREKTNFSMDSSMHCTRRATIAQKFSRDFFSPRARLVSSVHSIWPSMKMSGLSIRNRFECFGMRAPIPIPRSCEQQQKNPSISDRKCTIEQLRLKYATTLPIRLEKQINCFKVFWIQNDFEQFHDYFFSRLYSESFTKFVPLDRNWHTRSVPGTVFDAMKVCRIINIWAPASRVSSSIVQNIKSQIFLHASRAGSISHSAKENAERERERAQKRRQTISWMYLARAFASCHFTVSFL